MTATNWDRPRHQPAGEIPVRIYRQILMWPFLLETEEPDERTEDGYVAESQRWTRVLCDAGWSLRTTLPQAATPAGVVDLDGCAPTYEEVIYFHPFIRDFLYGDGTSDTAQRAMLWFFRDDVTELRVKLDKRDHEFLFRVPRVELYLFKPRVAILAVEAVWTGRSVPDADGRARPEELTLADQLLLQSRLRELYPPYFDKDSGAPGNCPQRVAWWGPDEKGVLVEKCVSDFDAGRDRFARQVQGGAEPPVASHWKWLLEPLQPYLKRGQEGIRFRQIVDDRIPGITYLAVDDPREIAPGDFDRLTFCETGGLAPYPYAREFLDARRSDYVYERYWREDARDDAGGLTLNTRYLCSGFQFVAVGSVNNPIFRDVVQDHVRRHYFRLGLLAHYHRAALLKFADEMAEAIKLVKHQSPRRELLDERLREHVTALQTTFLKFVSRAWFSEVSNQLQGQELFRLWSERLGNAGLFHEVDAMNDEMYSTLAERDNRMMTRINLFVAVLALLVSAGSLVISLVALSRSPA